MRLALICSSLEPGRDGVGDYTRQLAGELTRMGHHVLLLALHDRWLEQDRTEEQDGLTTMRFIRSSPLKGRTRRARQTLEQFDPDWVSLQYVCYGFHPKGLPWRWNRLFASLLTTRAKLHLMFHELWIGLEIGAPLRRRLVGVLQRTIICRMIQRLIPAVVSTSNETYREILQRSTGLKVALLPLFSNVPIALPVDPERIYQLCREQGVHITEATKQEFTLAGFFGTLHPEWPPEPFLTIWQRAEHVRQKQPVLLAMGRLGPGKALWDELLARYPGIKFANLGEQPREIISNYLQTLDFGIATSPVALLGKSSTVATMLDHGLPVVVNRDDWISSAVRITSPIKEGIFLLTRDIEATLAAGLKRRSASNHLQEVGELMERCLIK